jgi:hypothetical protein
VEELVSNALELDDPDCDGISEAERPPVLDGDAELVPGVRLTVLVSELEDSEPLLEGPPDELGLVPSVEPMPSVGSVD